MPLPPAHLPVPDAIALAHSERLRATLVARIQAAGGWLDFAAFMEGLLYAPGLGYYAAGAARFNGAGDFTTAPEISPLFGRTLARALAPMLRAIDDSDLLEPGAGSGRLAATLLPALAELGALPRHYRILEPSPALRAEQAATLAPLPAELRDRVAWIDDLPAQLRGVVLANEVLDAMPVHLLRVGDARVDIHPDSDTDSDAAADAAPLLERGVAVHPGGGFVWSDRPAAPWLKAQARAHLPAGVLPAHGAVFELGLAARAWSASLGERLAEGAVVLIDYGFPAREFHHAQRRAGTLMCHYRHHAHDDPFFLPGLQDVTAHVDFSAVAVALRDAGLRLHHFDSQAGFLLAHGLLEELARAVEPGSTEWLKRTVALQTLLSPAEMGELFKVLVALRDPSGRLAPLLDGVGESAVCARLGLRSEQA